MKETLSERPRLGDLGGGRNSRLSDLSATTWISGSCQTTDTTGKIWLSLCLSLHSSISYLQFISMLDMLLTMSTMPYLA